MGLGSCTLDTTTVRKLRQWIVDSNAGHNVGDEEGVEKRNLGQPTIEDRRKRQSL
jgi:hypothetical protein